MNGLNPDLTVDWNDPRNAPYMVPIVDEAMARAMADAIYGAVLDDDPPETTEADVLLYCRCLVDARRMVLDPDYAELFGA